MSAQNNRKMKKALKADLARLKAHLVRLEKSPRQESMGHNAAINTVRNAIEYTKRRLSVL